MIISTVNRCSATVAADLTLSNLDSRILFPTTCPVSYCAISTRHASRSTHQKQQRRQGPWRWLHRQRTPSTICGPICRVQHRIQEAEEISPGLTCACTAAFLHTRIPASSFQFRSVQILTVLSGLPPRIIINNCFARRRWQTPKIRCRHIDLYLHHQRHSSPGAFESSSTLTAAGTSRQCPSGFRTGVFITNIFPVREAGLVAAHSLHFSAPQLCTSGRFVLTINLPHVTLRRPFCCCWLNCTKYTKIGFFDVSGIR